MQVWNFLIVEGGKSPQDSVPLSKREGTEFPHCRRYHAIQISWAGASREANTNKTNDSLIHLTDIHWFSTYICQTLYTRHKGTMLRKRSMSLLPQSAQCTLSFSFKAAQRVSVNNLCKHTTKTKQILKQYPQLPQLWWGTSLCYVKSWVASILSIAILDLREIWEEKICHMLTTCHCTGRKTESTFWRWSTFWRCFYIWSICIARDSKTQELRQVHLKSKIVKVKIRMTRTGVQAFNLTSLLPREF